MNKGLAIIYDPHNLYQFLWYYCNQGKKKKWDALCLPNGYKGEYMHKFCEDSGIFEKVYRSDDDFSSMKKREKWKIVMQMFAYYIVGKQKIFCKKLLNKYVTIDGYDEIVVIADVGVVSGASIALGEEKKIIILEDGINDYNVRAKFIPRNKLLSSYAWQGVILASMGYCSPGWYYLDTDKFCIKYCSQPDKMKYRNYKEMRQLYTDSGTDLELSKSILKKIYPKLGEYDFSSSDAILLTRPLEDFVSDDTEYQKRLEDFISKRYQSIIIKKHPREDGHYNFMSTVKVQEIDNSIPAEALLSYMQGKEILLVTPSAIMIYFKAYNLQCKIITFDGLYEESIKTNSNYKPMTEKEVIEFGEKFAEGNYQIINL